MKRFQIGFVILAIVLGTLIIWAFTLLPYDHPGQAIDWKLFHRATQGFRIEYKDNRVYNPPWVLALLWPITIFPLEISRGIWALITLTVFVLCVPRTNPKLWIVSIGLLLLSYPMIRHLMDGNLEAIIVGGVILSLYAVRKKSVIFLGMGLILLSAKIQETWFFLILMVVFLWINWPWGDWIKAFVGAGTFAIPFFIWRGSEWIAAAQSFPYSETMIDSSLRYVLTRLGSNEWLAWVIWAMVLFSTLWVVLRSPKMDLSIAAILVTTGLMLSNYAAGDSLVTPLALGVVPFFQKKPAIGLALIILYFLPYASISNLELRFAWENIYWAAILLITWAALALDIQLSNRGVPSVPE